MYKINPSNQQSESTDSSEATKNIIQSIISLVVDKWDPFWVLLLVSMIFVSPYLPQSPTSPPEITLSGLLEYQQIQLEMTLTDVRAILNKNGIEVSNDGMITAVVWKIHDISIKVTFENGKVIKKSLNTEDTDC